MLRTIDFEVIKAVFRGDTAKLLRVYFVGLFVVYEKMFFPAFSEISQKELGDDVLPHGVLTDPC